MQPYNANSHHFSYFQCRCHPKPSPSSSFPQSYEPQFQTQLQVKKPFKSPFSIESLLGGETSHELSAFSSPSTKQETSTSTSVAAKLKELEDRRRNNSTSVPHRLRDKTKASTSAEIQTSHRGKSCKSIDLFFLEHTTSFCNKQDYQAFFVKKKCFSSSLYVADRRLF